MRSCSHTGLAIPECSCRSCLEDQVRRFQPELLGGSHDQGSIVSPHAGRRGGRRRLAA
jgi:hypothetical protein